MRNVFAAGSISRVWFAVLSLLMLALAGCGGGGGGASGCLNFNANGVCADGSGGGTTTTTDPTVTLTMLDGAGSATTTLPSSGAVTLSAVVKTATGATAPAGTLVAFTTDSSLGVFSPPSGTVLTNASGVATIQMSAASLSSEGASVVTASATLGTSIATGTTTFQVGAANLTLDPLNISPSSIPAYGTSIVSVAVNVNGVPSTAPLSVNFSSGCAGTKATLPASVQTVNGKATVTYTDMGCNGNDTIIATVLDKSVQGIITVAGPEAANIQFASASPGTIALKSTAGLVDVSTVTFKVVDASGNAVPSASVDFYLSNWTGGIRLDNKTQAQVDALTAISGGVTSVIGRVRKQTAADGTVSVAVQAGSNPASVWVLAKLKDTVLETQSSKLVISTGLPTQDRFSFAIGTHNIEGWQYDGVATTLSVLAFDRVGNPVPNGTTVNFITEGAGVVPSPGVCSIIDAGCTVTFLSGEYRPRDESLGVCLNASGGRVPSTSLARIDSTCVYSGRVSVLAYANGEESFDDGNGDNLYAANKSESHRPLGDVFVDNNENGVWDALEQFVPFQATGVNANTGLACPTGYAPYANAKSKLNTCNDNWGQAQVRRDQVIVLSGSYVDNVYKVSLNSYVPPSSTTLYVGDTFGGATGGSCAASFAFRISDLNNNPLPAGTALAVDENNVQYFQSGSPDPVSVSVRIGGNPVLDTTIPGGTTHTVTLSGSKCITIPAGTLSLKMTSPKGLISYVPVVVNQNQTLTLAGKSSNVSGTYASLLATVTDTDFGVANGTCSGSFELNLADANGSLPSSAQQAAGALAVLDTTAVSYEILQGAGPTTRLTTATSSLGYVTNANGLAHQVSFRGANCVASTTVTDSVVVLMVPTTTGRLARIPVTVRRKALP